MAQAIAKLLNYQNFMYNFCTFYEIFFELHMKLVQLLSFAIT